MAVYEINTKPKPEEIEQKKAGDEVARMRRRQMTGIALTALLLIGGGAFGYWKLRSNATPDEPLVDVPAGRGMFGGNVRRAFNAPAPPRDGVRQTGNGYQVRSGEALMVATKGKADEWHFSYRYQPGKFSSPDQPAYLSAKYQSMALGLTDEQKKQFEALPAYVGGMTLEDGDRSKLEKLFADYLAANDAIKPQKDKELTAALAEIGKKSEAASLAATDAYVAKIKAILTPQQVEKLSRPREGVTNPPASQPGQ